MSAWGRIKLGWIYVQRRRSYIWASGRRRIHAIASSAGSCSPMGQDAWDTDGGNPRPDAGCVRPDVKIFLLMKFSLDAEVFDLGHKDIILDLS